VRLLAYTTPARGHLYPIVRILQELRHRGHEIALRTLASQVSAMDDLGFETQAVSQRVEAVELDDYKARLQAAKGIRALQVFLRRAKREQRDVREAIEDESPDMLLIDCMAWGAAAVAEASGLPWAQFVPYPMPVPSPQLPPYGFGWRPASGPLGRLRDRAVRPLQQAGPNRVVLRRLNALRESLGIGALEDWTDVFIRAPLVLYLTAEPFEYNRDWPQSVRMVGPCSWDPASGSPRSAKPLWPHAWLTEVERPLILISTSSERQRDRRLVETAFEALGDEEVEMVATMPAEDLDGITVASNAHLEQFLPHTRLLERASCAITHGGAGVTQKALAAGVPVCVVPFGRDQHEVARRVEVAGAGVYLPSRRLTAARLRRAVFAAMECGEGAKRIVSAFAMAGGEVAAADAIEESVRVSAPTEE
jgi:MGT family glycosyltransferase